MVTTGTEATEAGSVHVYCTACCVACRVPLQCSPCSCEAAATAVQGNLPDNRLCKCTELTPALRTAWAPYAVLCAAAQLLTVSPMVAMMAPLAWRPISPVSSLICDHDRRGQLAW